VNYFVQQFRVFQQVCVQHPPFREATLQQSWCLLILGISAKFPFAFIFSKIKFLCLLVSSWRHFSFSWISRFPEFIYLVPGSGLPQCHSVLYQSIDLWTLYNFSFDWNNIRSKVWSQIDKNLRCQRTLAASSTLLAGICDRNLSRIEFTLKEFE